MAALTFGFFCMVFFFLINKKKKSKPTIPAMAVAHFVSYCADLLELRGLLV